MLPWHLWACFNRAMPPAPARGPERAGSYLVCATPRTGSSLLCGLLEGTGVAGHPESWFRRQDERVFAARWGIADPSDGTFGYASYFRAAAAAGSTANGVFAARIMWGTMDEVTAHLAPLHPEQAGSASGLLNAAFSRTRFVYLLRADTVAQAVSLLRAEQTGVWFETDEERQEPTGEPAFDFGQVRDLVRQIEDHNAAWEEWFAAEGVRPYTVLYEDLGADPVRVASGVLGFLGLDLLAGREIAVRHKRLADELNARWSESYRLQEAREQRGPERVRHASHRSLGQDPDRGPGEREILFRA